MKPVTKEELTKYGSIYHYRVGSFSSILGKPPVFYGSLSVEKANLQFGSVYAVTRETAEAITQAGTAANYRGIVWSRRLWIDFDNEQAAEAAKRQLKEMKLAHDVYTTGGRGCHIGILRDTAPSHLLPAQDKQWVKENLKGADLSLYWHLHLIRLPGAVHEKTKLPKKKLYSCSGSALVLPPWQEERLEVKESPGIAASRPPLFSSFALLNMLTEKPKEGSRHAHIVNTAVALVREGYTIEETRWLLLELNKSMDEYKTSEDIARLLEWAYLRNL